MLSSVGIYAFDWDTNRIYDDVIQSYINEIDLIDILRSETLICSMCNKRKFISEKIDGMDYCKCTYNINKNNINNNGNNKNQICSNNNDCNRKSDIKEWEPYLEKDGMIIWRKEEKPSLFAYKGKSNKMNKNLEFSF